MFGLHEYEYSSEEVFVKDVVLDVIGVVLHKEGQQLENETLELYSAVVILLGPVAGCVGQKWALKYKKDSGLFRLIGTSLWLENQALITQLYRAHFRAIQFTRDCLI